MRSVLVMTLILVSAAESQAFGRSRRGQMYASYTATRVATSSVNSEGVHSKSVTTTVKVEGAVDGLGEVNAERMRRGLRPYICDPGLTQAAMNAASYRAARLIRGHTANDFQFLPPGVSSPANGCGALTPDWGWGSCCTYDNYTYAGAAWVQGRDGRRYMHLFVR